MKVIKNVLPLKRSPTTSLAHQKVVVGLYQETIKGLLYLVNNKMVGLTRFQNEDMTQPSLFRAVSEVFLFLKQRSRTWVIKLFQKFKTRTKQTNATKILFSDKRQEC